MEYAALKQQTFAQWHFIGTVHRFFDDHHGHHGFFCDLARSTKRFIHQLLHWHDTANQPGPFRFFGIHEAARQVHIHGLGLTHQAGQSLCAANACDHTKVDLWLAKLRCLGTDDKVTHHRQLASTAQRIARYGGDDWLAHAHDLIRLWSKQIASERLNKGLVFHHRDVCTGGECFFRPGDHDRTDLLILLATFQAICQFAHQLIVERVHRVRSIERDQSHMIVDVQCDRFISHQVMLSFVAHRGPCIPRALCVSSYL